MPGTYRGSLRSIAAASTPGNRSPVHSRPSTLPGSLSSASNAALFLPSGAARATFSSPLLLPDEGPFRTGATRGRRALRRLSTAVMEPRPSIAGLRNCEAADIIAGCGSAALQRLASGWKLLGNFGLLLCAAVLVARSPKVPPFRRRSRLRCEHLHLSEATAAQHVDPRLSRATRSPLQHTWAPWALLPAKTCQPPRLGHGHRSAGGLVDLPAYRCVHGTWAAGPPWNKDISFDATISPFLRQNSRVSAPAPNARSAHQTRRQPCIPHLLVRKPPAPARRRRDCRMKENATRAY